MQAVDASAILCERPPKRCSPECSSCSSTASIWQPIKARRTEHLTSPQHHIEPAHTAMLQQQQQQQAAALLDVAAAPGAALPQQSGRTQHLLRLLILLRARRQLRSMNTAAQQQPQQQQLYAAPMLYCPQPLAPDAGHNLAVALSGTRASIDVGLQHLRTAATLLTAGCASSHAEAALAAAEAALADSIHSLGVAKAAAMQQLAAQLRAHAAAAAAEADGELQDTCCSSMACHTAA